MDGREGILYVNGKAVAVNNSVNLLPSDIGGTKNYFGRSQFSDPYFNGQLDSVKINSRALTLGEITAPSLAITEPVADTLYAGGDSIAYTGVGMDYSDTLLPPSAYTWSAEFHHDGVTDPFLAPATGATNGTLQIPTTDPASTNVFYRLNLLVTDTNGNQQSTHVDVLPQTGSLNLASVPPGLSLSVDGKSMNAPTSIADVAGMTRTLSAPASQNFAGSNYNFVVWSDGGTPAHAVSVPTNKVTFTASYVPPSLSLTAENPGTLSLLWPDWSAPFTLWSATNLAQPTVWSPVTNAPVNANGNLRLNLPAADGERFYRLQLP